ncbi:MAG: hypothetical protein LW884_00075 [Bacteroidetes bacterium]|jgi:sugar O-acyltransferase (sialic acid O-acetyltransferase NeuD family)|nr:hypothetical protein [Bacteroidota bacterium]
MKPLYLYGAGQHGRVLLEAARLLWPQRVYFFVDADASLWGGRVDKTPVLSEEDALQSAEAPEVVLGIGHNTTRLALMRRLATAGCQFPALVHPRAQVAASARLQAGCVVLPGAVVHSRVRCGDACLIHPNAVVEHDCVLAAGVQVGGLSYIGAECQLGEATFVGAGCTLLPRLQLAPQTVLGAASLLTQTVEAEYELWYGHPAQFQRRVDSFFNPLSERA